MAGLTLTGFLTSSVDEQRLEIEAALKSTFGESIDLDPQSNFGQLAGLMAERFADLWALGLAIYTAFDPDAATGVSLDNLAGLTGTVRNPATPSTVTLTLTGTIATALTAGTLVGVEGTATRFGLDALATIAAPPQGAWLPATAYVVGNRVSNTNGGPIRVYQCGTAGTSAGSGGPGTTASAITDGTITWFYLGDGGGVVDAAATCTENGPKIGAAGTVTEIVTPVSGWSNAVNGLDAAPGRFIETDSALRLRREAELRGAGKASLESIRAALLEVDAVTAATVFENVTDVTDGDGVPGHAVECLVQGGLDASIRAAIFAEIAAGIRAYGTTSGTVVDSQGVSHTIAFSRPTEKTVYVALTVNADVNAFPADGIVRAKQAIVDYGGLQKTGKDVVASAIEAAVFAAIPGVLDAIALIKLSATPTVRTTLAIASRELAVYDTSRIGVTVNFVTP